MTRILGTVEKYDPETGITTVRLDAPVGDQETARFTLAMLYHRVQPVKGQRVWIRPNHHQPLWLA